VPAIDEFDGEIGTVWRLIITDTENLSGVAPACPQPDVHAMVSPAGAPGVTFESWVFDECCIGPHLECWTEDAAREACSTLNRLSVEVCS